MSMSDQYRTHLDGQGNHSAHPIRQAGRLLADPQGIGDDNCLGAFEPVQIALYSFMKAITAILLLSLKDKSNIYRQPSALLLLHLLHCMNERQNWPLQATHMLSLDSHQSVFVAGRPTVPLLD